MSTKLEQKVCKIGLSLSKKEDRENYIKLRDLGWPPLYIFRQGMHDLLSKEKSGGNTTTKAQVMVAR